MVAIQGYGIGDYAPGIQNEGTDVYVVAHHQILAHAAIYRMYEQEFKDEQNGNDPEFFI